MTIKRILFTISMIISTNIFATAEIPQKDFVFDRGMFTEVNGNGLFAYIRLDRRQSNPSYVFKYTRVVERSKDNKLTEIGTLGSLEKMYSASISNKQKTSVDRFEKYAGMNTAIYCDDVEQVEDYEDNMYSIGAIVYGTRDLKYCPLVREFVALQKLAAEKNASETIIAETMIEQK